MYSDWRSIMEYFNEKQLAIALLIATLIPAGTVQAGWTDTFMATARGFITDTAMPYLKKPETYVLAAAAVVGSYFAGCELYWGMKSELPHNRAVDYLRSGLAAKVNNQEAANPLCDLVMNSPEVQAVQNSNNLVKKNTLDTLIKKYAYDYEFDRHATVCRVPDWHVNDIPVMDHSRVVCLQTGSNCGYHAAFNAARLLQLFKTNSGTCRDMCCDAIEAGPPVAEWKNVIARCYQTNQSDQSYENITDEAIRVLMVDQLHIVPNDFTCIANPSQDPITLDESLSDIITALQNGTKKAHAFLLGNMYDIGSVGGSGGHWIAAVVTTEGGMQVHVADSIADRLQGRKETVNQLIELLNQDIVWKKIQQSIESEIESAKNILEHNQDYIGCYKKLYAILERLKPGGLLARHSFCHHYGETMRNLLCILRLGEDEIVSVIVADNKAQYGISCSIAEVKRSVERVMDEMQQLVSEGAASASSTTSSSARLM